MKIYCAHSSGFDYRNDWYQPLKESALMHAHVLVFPHESEEIKSDSSNEIRSCDVIIAEISHPSKGMEIELNWAKDFRKPIIGFSKTDAQPTETLAALTPIKHTYTSPKHLLKLISHSLSHEMNHTQ